MGDQVAPGEMIQINGNSSFDQKLVFANNPYISQIPKEAQVALLVQGNIKGSQLLAQGRHYTFGQK